MTCASVAASFSTIIMWSIFKASRSEVVLVRDPTERSSLSAKSFFANSIVAASRIFASSSIRSFDATSSSLSIALRSAVVRDNFISNSRMLLSHSSRSCVTLRRAILVSSSAWFVSVFKSSN